MQQIIYMYQAYTPKGEKVFVFSTGSLPIEVKSIEELAPLVAEKAKLSPELDLTVANISSSKISFLFGVEPRLCRPLTDSELDAVWAHVKKDWDDS
ncbi:MAG: hypothetical protein WCS97_01635 [Candidatus Paceibacterota bacterium]|jgi:hypothetical protein